MTQLAASCRVTYLWHRPVVILLELLWPFKAQAWILCAPSALTLEDILAILRG